MARVLEWLGSANRPVLIVLNVLLLALVTLLDHHFGAFLPVSNLYYVPIVLAGAYLGYGAGLLAAGAAIVLFHVTHNVLPGESTYLVEANVLRLVLFLAAGLGTARLAEDRRRLARLSEELQARNTDLDRLNVRLSELSQAKTDFVGIAAHELKSPLTVVGGAAEILLVREDLAPDQRARLLTHIGDATERMRRTIDNFLDVALIEAGRLQLNREEVPLRELLEDCRRYYCGSLDGRVDWPSSVPDDCVLRVDRDKLLHALGNLLTNAAKYSPTGSRILVTAEAEGDSMRIAVSDEGYGIPPEDLGRIFERYYRSPDGRLSATKGSGLGLSVSRDIVLAHGGEIAVQSQISKGSTFTVCLPCRENQGSIGNEAGY